MIFFYFSESCILSSCRNGRDLGRDGCVGGSATVAIRNTSDITHFRLRNMNFFHNSLEIIFSNINNLYLTSIISLQATFENFELISDRKLTLISIIPLILQPPFFPTILQHPQPLPHVPHQTCLSLRKFLS